MEALVDPVLVVAVGDVGGGQSGLRHAVDAAALPARRDGTVACRLPVVAGLVGQRGTYVVQREGVVAVVCVQESGGQVDARVVGRIERETSADGRLPVTIGVVDPEVGVLDEAVVASAAGDQSAPSRLADGPRDDACGAHPTVVRGRQFKPPFRLRRRRARHHVDQPGQGVGTVESAPGSAQDLDLFDVRERRHGTDPGQVDTIDHEAHGRVQGFVELAALADTADLVVARPGRPAGVVHVRHRGQDLLEVGGAAGRDVVCGDHADARRRRAQGVLAQRRGDDDLLDGRRVGFARFFGIGRVQRHDR